MYIFVLTVACPPKDPSEIMESMAVMKWCSKLLPEGLEQRDASSGIMVMTSASACSEQLLSFISCVSSSSGLSWMLVVFCTASMSFVTPSSISWGLEKAENLTKYQCQYWPVPRIQEIGRKRNRTVMMMPGRFPTWNWHRTAGCQGRGWSEALGSSSAPFCSHRLNSMASARVVPTISSTDGEP